MTAAPVEWARAEAKRLRELATSRGPYDKEVETSSVLKPKLASALEFLRTQAHGTHFHQDADSIFSLNAVSYVDALEGVAGVLDLWANFVEAGMAGAMPYEAQARVDAATDLMEQVQVLLGDPKVHEAAPVVLAGAALEEFLRSRVATTGAKVSGKPSINAYANALKAVGDLSAAELKDITAGPPSETRPRTVNSPNSPSSARRSWSTASTSSCRRGR
jgi:hypothetical protein